MSNFTIEQEKPLPTLVTLGEDLKGQVDIYVNLPSGEAYRIVAIGDGKLHLFKMRPQMAKSIGLQLDAFDYPITYKAS